MRAFVYTDKALSSFAGQFAWLAIDTEKAANAAVLAKFPVAAWPSMFIVDPRTEKVLLRWTGAATVEQLGKLLTDGRAAIRSHPAATPLDTALAAADRLYGDAKFTEAAPAYAKVLEMAPSSWKTLPRVADAYLFALQASDQDAACAAAARELLPKLGGTPSFASVAATGLDCALALPKESPDRAAAVAALEPPCHQALADPKLDIAIDDQSGLYQVLISARDEAGDEAGKKALERDWVTLLENAAAKAPTAEGRTVFDSHRLSAYLEVGEPARAVPMLEASERDLPNDYNPPARLAVAFQAMKDYPRALAASDRALAKAYGPRRLGILRTRASIHVDQGDREAAKKVLQQALAEAAALPAAQRNPRTVAALEKQLAKLSASGG